MLEKRKKPMTVFNPLFQKRILILLFLLFFNRVREGLLMDPAVSNKKGRDDDINGMGKIVNKRVGALPLTEGALSHENDDLADHDGSVDDAGYTNPILLLDDSNRSNQIERTKEEHFHPHVCLIENRASHNKVVKVGGPEFMKCLNERLGRPNGVFASLLQNSNVRD